MNTKYNNFGQFILFYFWYFRVWFSAKRFGIKYVHADWGITEVPAWERWRELYKQITRDKSQDITYDATSLDNDEMWGYKEEEAIREYYRKTYNLNKKDVHSLHLSYSPEKIPKGLSYYEVKYQIFKYNYQNKKKNYDQ
jgi:hypothetical protein